MDESFQYTRRAPLIVPSHYFGGKAYVIDAEDLNLGKALGLLGVEFINVRKSGDRVAIPLWREPLLQLI